MPGEILMSAWYTPSTAGSWKRSTMQLLSSRSDATVKEARLMKCLVCAAPNCVILRDCISVLCAVTN